jgi:alkylation response protein AidB-like acyl-CoA dehydrogenase
VDFGLTEEQDQLLSAERAWLARHDPIAHVRVALDTAPVAIDPAAVDHADESGLLDLLKPEIGGTHVDLGVLSEVHGAAVSSLPVADLAIASWLLDVAGLTADCGLLGVLRGPAAPGAADLLPLRGTTSPAPMAADMGGFVIVGHLDADADYVAVTAEESLVAMTTLDLTRTWARVNLDRSLPAQQWRRVPAGTLDVVRDALAVHRAFDALGAAARLLDMTVEYAGQRHQFGAPIGSFQAVKHHCADMVMGVEAGRSTLWAAALALDTVTDSGARSQTSSAAAAYAKSAATRVAGTALQVHGGIGFTWEHDLHLFLRRIKVDEAVDGTVAEHRAALVPA